MTNHPYDFELHIPLDTDPKYDRQVHYMDDNNNPVTGPDDTNAIGQIWVVRGNRVFENMFITLSGEINPHEWLEETESSFGDTTIKYKKDILVNIANGNQYILHGCFPVGAISKGINVPVWISFDRALCMINVEGGANNG